MVSGGLMRRIWGLGPGDCHESVLLVESGHRNFVEL